MKIKALCIGLFLIASVNLLFGQNNAVAANKKTAIRCLNLAENYMLTEEWSKALSQVSLGLAYDETISDFYYIKAVAQMNTGATRADSLKIIKDAFDYDNWVDYNKTGARTFYANLLSEVGEYNLSLDILDEAPVIYSADAEFIRVKNYYRLGTTASIQQARTKLIAARRIYSEDIRFPRVFFLFEMLFMNYAERYKTPYEIPEIVQNLANAYIQKLPMYENDYSKSREIGYVKERWNLNSGWFENDVLDTLELVELEVIALMFCQGEEQTRLLQAIGEINQNSPLFAYIGLKAGIISEEKAFDLFFDSSYEVYFLNLLESFSMLLQNQLCRENFYKKLNSFSGTLIIDDNLDLETELSIKYERGRPKFIYYDKNNDQLVDIYAICDFGSPVNLNFLENVAELTYNDYPYVSTITYNQKNITYNFLNDDFKFVPFEILKNSFFSDYENLEFYIPYIQNESIIPEETYLVYRAATVELRTNEYPDSVAIYTINDGLPVFAEFYADDYKYAYSTIKSEIPFVRYVDYDKDNFYETAETFDLIPDTFENTDYLSLTDINFVKSVFGENSFSEKLYLKKVEIDRNGDLNSEFTEEYFGFNAKNSCWDDDEDGFYENIYIRYPDVYPNDSQNDSQNPNNNTILENKILKEESIFYNTEKKQKFVIHYENSIPVNFEISDFRTINQDGEKLIQEIKNNNLKRYRIFAGLTEGYYWLNEPGKEEYEIKIENQIADNMNTGAVQIIELEKNVRCTVIKIDKDIFCSLIPSIDVTQ